MPERAERVRMETARLVIVVVTVLVGISVIAALVMIVMRWATIPGYSPRRGHNTIFSIGMVLAGLLALRCFRASWRWAFVGFLLFDVLSYAGMVFLSYAPPETGFTSSHIYTPHMAILLAALIAGFRPSLPIAGAVIAYLLAINLYIRCPDDMGSPIIVALTLPLAAILVERLLDEVEKEAHRARLAETSIEVMTHDMGSPLAVLVSSLEILEEDELPPGQREFLMLAIQRNTDILRRLLDEFREIPYLDQSARMEMMDLRRIVHDVVDLYARPTCEKRGQTLHAHLEPVEIVGNPSRLSRVTRELLTNAMKFTPRGGHIEVTLHAADQAILCVSDNGWGFKEEELAHVFKQY